MNRFGGNLGQTAPWQLEMDGGVLSVFTSSLPWPADHPRLQPESLYTLEWKWAHHALWQVWLVGLCSCRVPVKYCSTRPMTQIFQQMISPRVSQLSIPDYFFRAHENESQLCVQFPPRWNLGSTSFPSACTPGLCQPETQKD